MLLPHSSLAEAPMVPGSISQISALVSFAFIYMFLICLFDLYTSMLKH